MQNDRKLAAILSADVAGYSRLMGDDENATLATLTEYREVMREQIAAHHGRVVNTPGDAMLAKFPSAVQTVESAIEIQRALAVRNAELPEHRRMRMRIDINLGDVIEQESALYGDGVNIAARLEALCEPGDVCVSGTIFDQVENKTSAGFKYAGEQTVKNIVKPVRAYHVRFSGAGSPARKQSARKAAFIVAGVVCAVLVGLAIWMTNSRQHWPDAAHDALLEMPTGPVIAVLPFTNMSGDSNQDYFSDGLTEDIITELARFREIYVLARNTTFQYKGQSVDVPAVARELGAQYVLEGSVRKSNHRVRITAQLIDASTGSHIWADRFDRDFSDVFEIQDEVTQKIVGLVAGGHGGLIQDTEKKKGRKKTLDQMEAYELVLKSKASFYTQDWYDTSKAALEKAIAIDAEYARARHEYAWLRMMGWIFRLDNSPTPPSEILENAVKAVRLDPNDAYAHRTAAYGYYFRKQFDAFEAEALEAIRLAPYNAEIYAQIGMLFAFNGQWERGTSLVEKAFAINPISAAAWGHSALYYNHYRLQQYKKALNVMMSHPSTFLCENQMKFVAVYGQLGRPEKAKEHWANCEKTVANVSADLWAHVMRVWNFQKPFIEHYVQGIEKAGYPCRSTPCGLQDSEQAGKEQG